MAAILLWRAGFVARTLARARAQGHPRAGARWKSEVGYEARKKQTCKLQCNTKKETTVGRFTTDIYFSADVETDGPIPGPYSMLSFALVYAGKFDGKQFVRPDSLDQAFSIELRPISENYQEEALRVNGLDRAHLAEHGVEPEKAMKDAAHWVRSIAGNARPVLVAYPLSFDWTWLYWYFMNFSQEDSPFNHSACFDLKTAYAVKANIPIAKAGRKQLDPVLKSSRPHTHDALQDAREQAEIFGNLFEWKRSQACL